MTKYLKANIEYEKLTRIEEYPFPEAALREALLNAIAHKDYSSGNPIQISVYSDKILFWNEGQLPKNWKVAQLLRKHPSKPFNPDIANVFFRAGLIEAWGRGIHKIILECRDFNSPKPVFRHGLSGFSVEIFSREIKKSGETPGKSSPKSSPKTEELILEMIRSDRTISTEEMGNRIGKTKRAVLKQIDKLKKQGVIERIGPARGGHWKILE